MALRKIIFVLIGVISAVSASAQTAMESAGAETQDFESLMRADGKVAVTIVISSIVLAGMVVFLINAERRLKKLEQDSE